MPPKRKQPSRASKSAHSVLQKRSSPSDESGDEKRQVPAPASSSSSSSSSAAPPSASKYYFLPTTCRSYTLEELWAINDSFRAQGSPFPHDRCVIFHAKFPCGTEIKLGSYHFTERCDARHLDGKLPAWVSGEIVDWARTSDQSECVLSADPFDNPHLLSLNGRSYSFAAIQRAIKCTLAMGENLRLEDVTLTPLDVTKIHLYPNYSLPGWRFKPNKVTMDEKVIPLAKLRYDGAKILEKNVPAISALFDKLPVTEDGYHQSGKPLLDAYNCHHGTIGKVVQNLGVSRAVFPRSHLKLDSPVMQNVMFHSCVIYVNCWCGIRFVGCRFDNCVFVISKYADHFNLSLCEETNCKWVVQGIVPAGGTHLNPEFNRVRAAMKFERSVNTRLLHVDAGTFTDEYMRTATYADIMAHPAIRGRFGSLLPNA